MPFCYEVWADENRLGKYWELSESKPLDVKRVAYEGTRREVYWNFYWSGRPLRGVRRLRCRIAKRGEQLDCFLVGENTVPIVSLKFKQLVDRINTQDRIQFISTNHRSANDEAAMSGLL